MTRPFDAHDIQTAHARVVDIVEHHGSRVVVTGGPGTGRTTLVENLAEQQQAYTLDLLGPHAADNVSDAILQVAHHSGKPIPRALSFDDRVDWTLDALRGLDRPWLVIRLHDRWGGHAIAPDDPGVQGLREHASRWLDEVWRRLLHVVVVLVGQVPERYPGPRVRLGFAGVRWDALADDEAWGAYQESAWEVRKRFDRMELSPLVARLAVGRVHLGDSAVEVEKEVRTQPRVVAPHVRALIEHVRDDAELLTAMRRLARIRRPLLRETLPTALGLAADHPHLPLFEMCLSYPEHEGDTIRTSEPVRAAVGSMLRELRPVPTEVLGHDHAALAEACRTMDGVVDPASIRSHLGVFGWSEKVHHLAQAGSVAEEAWAAHEPFLQPEQLWDKARALSRAGLRRRDRKLLQRAADLYNRCRQVDGDDDYSWHYLAFNLDAAGAQRALTDEAFAKAVELDPTNPWWNSRRITFLIGQVRYRDAERAFEQALAALDPSGVLADSWLVRHFHRHVVEAWLGAGETRRARRAFDTIPAALDAEPTTIELRKQLEDAEEAAVLQGSIRPYGLLGEARHAPVALPELFEGLPRQRWYAGRVEGLGDEGIRIRAASMEHRNPRARRILGATLTWTQWEAWTRKGGLTREELADRFVEIGEYGPDPLVVVRVLDPSRRPEVESPGRSWIPAW